MGAKFVDFQKLRETITLEQIVNMLQLQTKPSGKNLRADCPFCEAKSALYLNREKQLWYAHCCQIGGDGAGLYAKVKGIGNNEAGNELAAHFNVEPGKRPDIRIDKDECPKLDYLIEDHDACRALGLTPEICKEWQAGYAPRGTLVSCICIPVFQGGKRLGYVGYKKGEPMKKGKSIPDGTIFNGDNATNEEPLHVAPDPLSAVLALSHGVPNVVSFLGETGIHDLAALVLLMKEKGIGKYEIL